MDGDGRGLRFSSDVDVILFRSRLRGGAFVASFGYGFARIIGTVHGAERAALLSARLARRLKALLFDGKTATPELRHAIGEADAALISIPQDESGDLVLRAFGDALGHAQRSRSIVYLSTVDVYGDRGARSGRFQ
jgi:hypothetical protein